MDDVVKKANLTPEVEQPTNIFHSPCAFNPKGVSLQTCESTTAVLVRNQSGCCRISCTSSARACIACLRTGGGKSFKVEQPGESLCAFHKKYGAEAVRPKAVIDGQVISSESITQEQAEKIKSPVSAPAKPAPQPPAPSHPAPTEAAAPKPKPTVIRSLADLPPPAPALAAPEQASVDNGAGRPLKVPLSRLLRYKGQPRRYFNEPEIAELADDIQLKGQETPNRVFPIPEKPGYFMLIGGERRWRAYQLIAQRTRTDPLVDCVLGDVKDARDHFRKAFRDNIKRKDYIPRDEANAYQQMYDDSPMSTHEEKVLELMRDAGKPKKHIENYLLVAGLPTEAKDLMNPDLLDKQLVYLVALEIARSTTDRDLRIELARDTSQQCMGLPQARFYIRKKTGHSNYGGSGRPRVPADEYKAFKSVLAVMNGRLERIKEDWDIGGVYESRPKPDEDRERDAEIIKGMISELKDLLGKVEGKPKKTIVNKSK